MAMEACLTSLSEDLEATNHVENIRQTVENRTSGRIRELSISVDGTRLIISGRTSTYYSKQLATHAALDVAQQLVIQNDVVVGA